MPMKTPMEAGQAAFGAMRRKPKTTGFFATLAGLIALVWGGAEPCLDAGQAALAYKQSADEAHEIAIVAQVAADKAQKQLDSWIRLEEQKRARAEAEAEVERKADERTVRWCDSGVIVDQRVCAEARDKLR
jgi:hypothetical protein